jgi:hypothetical protein
MGIENSEAGPKVYKWEDMTFTEVKLALGEIASDMYRDNRDITNKEMAEKMEKDYNLSHTPMIDIHRSEGRMQGQGMYHYYEGTEEDLKGDTLSFKF